LRRVEIFLLTYLLTYLLPSETPKHENCIFSLIRCITALPDF